MLNRINILTTLFIQAILHNFTVAQGNTLLTNASCGGREGKASRTEILIRYNLDDTTFDTIQDCTVNLSTFDSLLHDMKLRELKCSRFNEKGQILCTIEKVDELRIYEGYYLVFNKRTKYFENELVNLEVLQDLDKYLVEWVAIEKYFLKDVLTSEIIRFHGSREDLLQDSLGYYGNGKIKNRVRRNTLEGMLYLVEDYSDDGTLVRVISKQKRNKYVMIYRQGFYTSFYRGSLKKCLKREFG